MDRFQSFQVFVRVAETASFAAAARGLGMSPPAVTRAVSALEERLGTRLLVRTTRSVRLSDSGTRFLDDCRRILGDLQEAENSAIGLHATPSGELRITAPVLFGRHVVTPILGDFLERFPQVSATTLFIDRVVNLMDEGLDVAIRIGDLPDSSLSAIRVGSVRRVVFAAPDYLKRYGKPRHPDDLADHRVVQSLALGSAPEWRFQVEGKPYAVRLTPRVRMNTPTTR
jgi:DNA-binding transcriptional LysR family regulator